MRTVTAAVCAALAAVASAHSAPHRLSLIPVERVVLAPDAATSLSASPAMITNNEWVNVSFVASSPAGTDWVAAYSPPPTNWSAQAPIEWFLTGGKAVGTLRFQLVNMRAPVVFAYLRGATTDPVVVATSNPVAFRNYNEPRAPRLVLLNDSPSTMLVTWTSATTGGNPRVVFTDANGRSQTVPAASETYAAKDMCGAPATTVGYRDPGVQHTAAMVGLTPGARYSYVFGDDSELSAPVAFTQPPAAYPYAIAAYGDEGQGASDGATIVQDFPPAPNTSSLVAAWMDATPPGFVQAVHHIGDISYARGYAADWDVFTEMNAKISSRVPYFVDMGNHEADFPDSPSFWNGTDSGGECGVPTRKLFPMPSPSFEEPWFAIMHGPVAVIHMTTEWDFTTGSPQWTFLKNALASVDRSVTPWAVLASHRPMYISSTNFAPNGGDQTVAELLRQHVEPLLMAAPSAGHPVDLALWGHHHSYQRMCASYAGACVQHSTKAADGSFRFAKPGAPVHMVIGTAGAGFSTNVMVPPPVYNEFVSFTHGYARIVLHNDSALQWQFVNDLDGSVLEEMWILH